MAVKIMSRRRPGSTNWSRPSDIEHESSRTAGLAGDDAPHGLAPGQIEALHERGQKMLGGVYSPRTARNALLEQALPPGRSPDYSVRRAQTMASPFGSGVAGNSGSSFFSTMRPYQPEFESPDRQMFPVHRRMANTYWRLFNKMDPVIAAVIDMFSQLPWGDFQLTGEGVDGEVKEAFEYMVTETRLKTMLPMFVSEFLVIGEVIPHLFFDDSKGVWTHIALHNPDQVNVVYSPFIRMDTIMEFVPDPKLRELVTSNHPMLARVRETMPSELVSHLRAGQNIPLSPVNATFIPRKLHPYDLRGTSIIARMWRTLMLEDAIWNATIQTARRAACFVAGTPVLTTTGLVPIERVKPGDRLVAGNGRVETVEHAWEEAPDGGGLIELKAMGTRALLCTPQHRFKVWAAPRSCACGCGTPVDGAYANGRVRRRAFASGHHLSLLRDEQTGQMQKGVDVGWRVYSTEPKVRAPEGYEPLQKLEAKDIRPGDYLVIPRTFDQVETSVRPEAARLLGYFVAEGSERRATSSGHAQRVTQGVGFTFSLAESATWAADVVACAAQLGVDATLYRYVPPETSRMAQSGREGRTDVYIQRQKDEDFALWLRTNGGVGASTHQLSEEVMRWPLSLKEELVRGYFRGDGHLGFPSSDSPQCPQVTAASTSQTLVYQLRIVLAQLGYFASISYSPKGHKEGEENWSDCWILSTTGRDARALAQLIWGLTIDAPKLDANGARRGGGARTWKDNEYIYVPVQEVTHHDEHVPTYNLSVSGDHSYLVEAVQTFNSPLKVVKLGDPTTGFIPPPSEEKRVLGLLAQAEMDPQAWIAYNYQASFELAGAPERIMSINQHYDLIERIKLVALGVSKSFVSGETSYSSAASGLTVFLQRLKAVRDFFVNEWLIPKYFLPVAVINEWVKPSKAQASRGHVRVKRSARELMDERRYIVPTLEWAKSLDPQIDKERIDAMMNLEQNLGIKITDQKKYASIGLDSEEEQKQLIEELKFKRDLAGKDPMAQALLGLAAPPDGGAGGGGGPLGGGVISPGIPPEAMGMPGGDGGGGAPGGGPGDSGGAPPGEGPPAPPSPEGAHVSGEEGAEVEPAKGDTGESRHWASSTVSPLLALFDDFDINHILDEDCEPWVHALEDVHVTKAVLNHDAHELWLALEQWLIDESYPAEAVKELHDTLTASKKLKTVEAPSEAVLSHIAAQLGVDSEGSDLVPSASMTTKRS